MRYDVRDEKQSNTIAKSQAGYINEAIRELCENCSMFRNPDSCTLVRGTINKTGHCDYYESKAP